MKWQVRGTADRMGRVVQGKELPNAMYWMWGIWRLRRRHLRFCCISKNSCWCGTYGSTSDNTSLAGMSQKWCSFLISPVRWHTISTYCIINDVYFDHVVKVVSAMLFHCNTILFSLVVRMYFVRRFKSMQIPLSSLVSMYACMCVFVFNFLI